MKRFLVFTFPVYEAEGGWNDFCDSFESLEDAREYVKSLGYLEHDGYAHIVDSLNGKIVEYWSGDPQTPQTPVQASPIEEIAFDILKDRPKS